MKAYIGDQRDGAAIVVGVKEGKVVVATTICISGNSLRPPDAVEKVYEVDFSGKRAPKGWRRYPKLDWAMEKELAGRIRFEEWKLKGEKCC